MKIFLFIVFLALFNYSIPSIIGIDIGSEFYKVVLVKTNEPFKIIENEQFKRTTHSVISLQDTDRYYGFDAYNKKSRNPTQTFSYLNDFIGKTIKDESLKQIIADNFLPYNIEEDKERDTISFKIRFQNKDYNVPVEELYAMIFRKIRFYTEKIHGSRIRECVVTIPSFYGQRERIAIAQAINLAGMNLLNLISDNVAASVYHAFEKKGNDTERIIFYNVGASHTQATLAEITELEKKENRRKINYKNVKIIAETWDRNLGGRNFNSNLAKYFLSKYPEISNAKQPLNVQQRLLQETNRVKEVLSIEKEVLFSLEVDGNKISEKITRETFENLNRGLNSKHSLILDELLSISKLTIDDIHKIHLIGGSGRVPAIQEELRKKFGDKLSKSINGDEYIPMGAAFTAANSSKTIKTKHLGLTTGVNYDLIVKFKHFKHSYLKFCNEDIPNNSEYEGYTAATDCNRKLDKNFTLFSAQQPLNFNRSVNLRHDGDFDIEIYQKFRDRDEELLASCRTKYIQDKNEIMVSDNASFVPPRINIKFNVNKLGIVDFKITHTYNYTLYLNVGKGQFGGVEAIYKPRYFPRMTEEEYLKLMKDDFNIIPKEGDYFYNIKDDVGKPSLRHQTSNITMEFTSTTPGHLDLEQLNETRIRLRQFDEFDFDREEAKEARNSLESFLGEASEWMDKEDAIKYSTDQEKQDIRQLLSETKEWFEEISHNANKNEIREKMSVVGKAIQVISNRRDFDHKINHFTKAFEIEYQKAKNNAENIFKRKPWIDENTKNEIYANFESTYEWFKERKEKQENLSIFDTPAFTPEQIEQKALEMVNLLKNLDKIKKPVVVETTEKVIDIDSKETAEKVVEEKKHSENIEKKDEI